MLHILVLSHYFPPEVNAPANRLVEHARFWIKEGHTVTVVTCAPNHPTGKLYSGYRNRIIQEENIEGIRVIRVWTWLAANKGFLNRVLNHLSYMFTSALALKKISEVDVIISSTPQFFCGLAGFYARWKQGAPWVLEVRDLWPDSILAVGAMKEGLIIRFLKYLEYLAYRRAYKVVAISDGFIPHIAQRRGVNDIIVINNGVDLKKFEHKTVSILPMHDLKLEGKIVVSYIGTIGMAHKLETILEAAKILSNVKNIVFLIIGEGAERERLKLRAKKLQLSNLHIIGQVEREKIQKFFTITNISLVLLRKSESFKVAIPSKIFEAMAMERPIILGVEGKAAELIRSAGAGTVIPPENPGQLAAAILEYVANPKLAKLHGKQGRTFVESHFDRKKFARKYLDVLEGMSARGSF